MVLRGGMGGMGGAVTRVGDQGRVSGAIGSDSMGEESVVAAVTAGAGSGGITRQTMVERRHIGVRKVVTGVGRVVVVRVRVFA